MVNTSLTYKGRKIQNRATNILGPVFAIPLVIITIAATPIVLLIGLVVLLVGALKPLVIIAGLITTVVGVVSLVNGQGWTPLLVGLGLLFIAKQTKVTFNK